MGWSPGEAPNIGSSGVRLLLGADQTRCRAIHQDLSCVQTRQAHQHHTSRPTPPSADTRETLGKRLNGFHHSATIFTGEQWDSGRGGHINQVCHLHSNEGSMCSRGCCEFVLQECCEDVGVAFEHCVKQGHMVHQKVLDRVVQTCGNKVVDHHILSSVDELAERMNQQAIGGVFEALCALTPIRLGRFVGRRTVQLQHAEELLHNFQPI